MEVLTDKDRIDAKPAVLKSHVEAALQLKAAYPEKIYYSYVLNPRIFNEVMTDYRGTVKKQPLQKMRRLLSVRSRKKSGAGSRQISLCPEAEQESVYFVPAAPENQKIQRTFPKDPVCSDRQNLWYPCKTESHGRSNGIPDAGSGKTGSRRLCRQPFPGSDRRKGKRVFTPDSLKQEPHRASRGLEQHLSPTGKWILWIKQAIRLSL